MLLHYVCLPGQRAKQGSLGTAENSSLLTWCTSAAEKVRIWRQLGSDWQVQAESLKFHPTRQAVTQLGCDTSRLGGSLLDKRQLTTWSRPWTVGVCIGSTGRKCRLPSVQDKSTTRGLLSSSVQGLSAHLVVQALGQDVLQIAPQGFGVPQNALVLRLGNRLLHSTQLCMSDVFSTGREEHNRRDVLVLDPTLQGMPCMRATGLVSTRCGLCRGQHAEQKESKPPASGVPLLPSAAWVTRCGCCCWSAGPGQGILLTEAAADDLLPPRAGR